MPSSHSCVASTHRIRRTIIGHLTGRVIWDSSKPYCCNQPQSAIPHSAPGATRLCIQSATGLGVQRRRRLRALASGIASMGPDQKVTLQAGLAGRAHLVATCHERDLDHALADVRRDLIRQIEEERSRRDPASAGRPVIARLDPGPGFDGALYHDPAVVPVGGRLADVAERRSSGAAAF
jgi:hypothetical protein